MIILINKQLSEDKKLYVALSKIFGINYTYSKNLCSRIGVNDHGTVYDLTNDLIKVLLKNILTECIVERELKASFFVDIKKKLKIKNYQGRRHLLGLPVNGQNTKNNSKTAKKLLKQNGFF